MPSDSEIFDAPQPMPSDSQILDALDQAQGSHAKAIELIQDVFEDFYGDDAHNQFTRVAAAWLIARGNGPEYVRVWTKAPVAYDGFGTVTLDTRTLGDTEWRKVATPQDHATWQHMRYASGMHTAWEPEQFEANQDLIANPPRWRNS